jgi:hypothetical protein
MEPLEVQRKSTCFFNIFKSSLVIPSVLKYYLEFMHPTSNLASLQSSIMTFLWTSSAMGMLFKRGASLSAAEVGCQGNIFLMNYHPAD